MQYIGLSLTGSFRASVLLFGKLCLLCLAIVGYQCNLSAHPGMYDKLYQRWKGWKLWKHGIAPISVSFGEWCGVVFVGFSGNMCTSKQQWEVR